MSKAEFVHLHLHSEFSLLDGACRFNKLCKRVKELGMDSVGLTDHGNLFGAVNFYKTCKDAEVKPILGCELYVAPRGRHERGESGEKRSANHLLLLAETYEGYLNLCKLSSIGYVEGYYYKPRIDHEVLAQYSKGLLATSSCLKGEIPQALCEGNEAHARKLMDEYMEIFGRENFYLEVQDHNIPGQKIVLRHMREFAKHYDLPLLATNDCHYVNQKDSEFHDILLCIQTGKTMQDPNRFKFSGPDYYVKSGEEMYEVFGEIPDSCRNTVALAERCNVELKFKQKLLPVFHPPDEYTIEEYLRARTYEGLNKRYGTPSEAQIDRAEMELTCIQNMGFSSYFLIVWDFIHYAKVNGIPVGPGRGSAAGSLVAYALEITDIDPIEHGLIFERFLNPDRVSLPDIDIDFCFENRGRVIEYVKQKYGPKSVAQIITFGTLKPKNAIRDIGRAMDMPLPEVDKIAKLIPAMLKTEKGKTGIDTALETITDLKNLYDTDPTTKKVMDYARDMEGMARHASTHAAGVVICDFDITDVVPIYKPPDASDIATQFTMTTVEDLGLLKMDFLGLKNLTVIENTLRSVRKNYGVEIDWSKLTLNDPKSYKMLCAGGTFGVFQLESSGMTSLVKSLAPSTFADLTALLALYRPGPLGSGMVEDYVARKHGRKDVVYDHPCLEPILKETYGIILYQEQVMKIAQVMGGFTLGGADLLRRAMGKKKAEEMAKMLEMFVAGAENQGINGKLAAKVFQNIEYFAGYGFNKSHSAAYAVVSFRTAYLKAHYPVDYLAALMTNAIGGKVEDIVDYFAEAKEMGVRILPPDINESDKHFTVSGKNIRFGLAAVKNVGEAVVEAVIAAREQGGKFKTFEEMCKRLDGGLLNSRVLECLIKVGAFDSLGHKRSQLLDACEGIVEMAHHRQKEKQSGQTNLFEIFDDGDPSGSTPADDNMMSFQLRNIPEIEDRKLLDFEKELLGYYVSGHPLDAFMVDIKSFSTVRLAKLSQEDDGTVVSVVGMVNKVVTKVDRNGGNMGFVEITDGEASVEIVFFKDSFEKARSFIATEQVIVVKGRVNERNGEKKLLANDAKPIEAVREKQCKCLEIRIDFDAARNGLMEKMDAALRSSPGKKPVRLMVSKNSDAELKVDLPGRMGVALTTELVQKLKRLPGVREIIFCCGEDD